MRQSTIAQWYLNEWGRWARSEPFGPSSLRCPMSRWCHKKTPSKTTSISEDEALKVDVIVARLKKCDSLAGRAVKHFYVGRVDSTSLSGRLGVNQKRAISSLETGERYVAAMLDIKTKEFP